MFANKHASIYYENFNANINKNVNISLKKIYIKLLNIFFFIIITFVKYLFGCHICLLFAFLANLYLYYFLYLIAGLPLKFLTFHITARAFIFVIYCIYPVFHFIAYKITQKTLTFSFNYNNTCSNNKKY